MKKLGRIAAAFMASVFFVTGIPAMTAFAADEIPVAEETVTETPAVETVTEQSTVPETPAPVVTEPVVTEPVVTEPTTEGNTEVVAPTEPEVTDEKEDTNQEEGNELNISGTEKTPLKAASNDTLADANGDDSLDEPSTTVSKVSYDGDSVKVITEDGNEYRMLRAIEGTGAVISGSNVIVTLVPTSQVYNTFHWGSINDENLSTDETLSDGKYVVTLSTDNCGFGIPIAPISSSSGNPASSQCYLAIPKLQYVDADYSAVEAAKAKVPADLSKYTEASVAALNEALAAVVEGKKADEQATVDAWAEAIEKAIERLVDPSDVKKIPYDGDAVKVVKDDLISEFGMLTPQEGSSWALKDGNVAIHIIPSNTTVYGWWHWGAITDELTKDFAFNSDGTIDLALDTSYCGYAHPIAPIKKKDGKTSSAQYYLAVPVLKYIDADYSAVDAAKAKVPADLGKYTAESIEVLNKALAAVVEGKKADEQATVDAWAEAIEKAVAGLVDPSAIKKIPYDGDEVKFVKEDLESTFGMLTPEDGSTWEIKDGKVTIHIVPTNKTVYGWWHWGSIYDSELTKDVTFNSDGTFDLALDKNYCGYAHPIAPIKIKDEKTTSSQYYLAIPAEDKLPVADDDDPITPDDPSEETSSNATVEVKEGMFNVVGCVVTKKADGTYDAVLTLSGTGYDKLYKGSAADAPNHESAWVPFVKDSSGKYTFKLENVPIGEFFGIAAYGIRGSMWRDRTIKITLNDSSDDSGSSTPSSDTTPTNDGKAEKESEHTADTSKATAAVDNSTALADGVYTPDKFSFSGGSGRGSFTCTKVTVTDGKAYATLVFSSNNYQYVKASGNIYYCDHSSGLSTVTIPVALNQNNTIVAMTTAMSAAHEITYTMFVYIAGADAQKGGALTNNDKLDEEAPVIPGLEFIDEEKLDYAEYFKVFNYADGIRLLEVDMTVKDDKKAEDKETAEGEATTELNEPPKTNAALFDEEDELLIAGNEAAAEEKDEDTIKTTADAQAELYKGNVIKYLLVPEDVEIPAGLEKEVIVIQLPVESVYSGADDLTEIMKELKVEDLITSQVKEDKDNKEILEAGDYKDLDLKALVKSKCDLVLLPEDSIEAEDVKDAKAQKEAKENFETLAEDLANLEIPVIVDRAEYEESKEAKAEWIKVFGMIFGCEKEANELYETMIK